MYTKLTPMRERERERKEKEEEKEEKERKRKKTGEEVRREEEEEEKGREKSRKIVCAERSGHAPGTAIASAHCSWRGRWLGTIQRCQSFTPEALTRPDVATQSRSIKT